MEKQKPECLLPLLKAVEQMLAQGGHILAIDGGSASGKTSLAARLQELYDCPVFHTDDFFLRPEQRTEARLSEPGGNMDRERFFEQILTPLRAGKTVCYEPFSCKSMQLLPPVTVEPGQLNVIEGAYCMHPELADAYDLSVFLEVEPDVQRERILRRSPEKAEQFFARWIPMEQRYFDAMKVRERCRLCLRMEDLV